MKRVARSSPERAGLRADLYLVKHGFAASRSEAAEAIAAGGVLVDGRAIDKPSATLHEGAFITYRRPHPYVSRGGIKLAFALDTFGISPAGLCCLDLGASTGGFTQVLLERGAARVCAIDVGRDQLSAAIASDPRVISLEGVNARDLDARLVPEPPDAIVADMSFISLKLALPKALALAKPGAWLIALFKPQFEVGRAKLGKGGIVRDAQAREAALGAFVEWLEREKHWRVAGTAQSPIAGGDGNIEYLVAARKE